jgi:hypothetical protein
LEQHREQLAQQEKLLRGLELLELHLEQQQALHRERRIEIETLEPTPEQQQE